MGQVACDRQHYYVSGLHASFNSTYIYYRTFSNCKNQHVSVHLLLTFVYFQSTLERTLE